MNNLLAEILLTNRKTNTFSELPDNLDFQTPPYVPEFFQQKNKRPELLQLLFSIDTPSAAFFIDPAIIPLLFRARKADSIKVHELPTSTYQTKASAE